jgi:hypothetical protein
MRVFILLVVVLLVYNVLPNLIRSLYGDQGHGDQHLTFWVVFSSFMTPLLWPVLHLKTLVLNILLPAANLGWMEGKLTYLIGRTVLTPVGPFSLAKAPPKPDYGNEDYWSMLPERTRSPREDAGNVMVGDPSDYLPEKICSAFYL